MLYDNKITTSEKFVCVPSGSVATPMDHSNDITRVHLTTRFYKMIHVIEFSTFLFLLFNVLIYAFISIMYYAIM